MRAATWSSARPRTTTMSRSRSRWQDVTIPSAGSYQVVIQVVSGTNPGHVEFLNLNENVNVTVSQTVSAVAGGTYYPTSFGHHTATNTIGVGATPWWAPAPYLAQNPLANEPFSSDGPAHHVLNASGQPLSSPETVLNPTITAPDGGNTSFFSAGFDHQHEQPSIPGPTGHPDQPLAEPAQLLRHLVGRAQCGGRRRVDETAGPLAHARPRSRPA